MNHSGTWNITPDGKREYHNTSDGHGGKSEEHRKEMEEIARKVCAEQMP